MGICTRYISVVGGEGVHRMSLVTDDLLSLMTGAHHLFSMTLRVLKQQVLSLH